MKTICIFNPEHDLCLSNGSSNFMPPASALAFARKSTLLMKILYPDAECVSVSDFVIPTEPYRIVPWGWNLVIKNQLQKAGVPEKKLMSDDAIRHIRKLQHRLTALPLQPDVRECRSIEEIESGLANYGNIVLKSPLSGSGRGLRWINGAFVENDRFWISKQLQQHKSIMLEPKREVVCDFAFEYVVGGNGLSFVGYSLFDTRNGVYRGNYMLSDDEIAQRLTSFPGVELERLRAEIDGYLSSITSQYMGPLGVDLMICKERESYSIKVAEINFRHTMGLVAHELFLQNRVEVGSIWSPEL